MNAFLKLFIISSILPFISFCTESDTRTAFEKLNTNNKEITFWHTMNSEETQTLKKIIAEFEKENPTIKVRTQMVPFSDAQNKYKIAAGAGDAPDVFRAEIAWIADLAELGFLEDLKNKIPKSDLEDYLPAALAYGKYKSSLWAIPQVTDCLALLYNKSLLKSKKVKVPESFADLVKIGPSLTNPGNGEYALGFNPEGYWAQIFIWAFGGNLIDGETREILVSNEASLQGMEFLKSLYFDHKIMSDEIDFVNGYNNMMTSFKQGKTAMIFNGPWSTSDILKGEVFKDQSNLGVGIIPKGPSGFGSPVGGHSYVLYAGSKYKEASLKFIQFLSETKNQVEFAVKHNLLPTRKSAYDNKDLKKNSILQGFKAQLEVATNRPVIPEGARIYTDLNTGVQQVLSGSVEPKKAMEKVAKKWKKFLR